jgi:predicted transcriptional regulator
MAYQEEDVDNIPDVSEEDSLLRPGMLSEKEEHYLDSYNRLIEKGFLSALTQNEYKVWRLFSCTQADVFTIAKELTLSVSMVRKYIKQVTNKLREELEIEHNWSRTTEQKYSNTGFKKNLKITRNKRVDNKDSDKTELLFKERLKAHKKEIDDWLKKNPLVRRKLEDDNNEDN